MEYLCLKHLKAGGTDYYPGDTLPDGAILPERSGKLGKSGYISEIHEPWTAAAELKETAPGAYAGKVIVAVKSASGGEDEQTLAVPVSPEEIQQVFDIMQMGAEDGARAVTDVESENVLILLHAADSRKTVRNAAKEQADKLFSTKEIPNGSTGGNETTGTNTEGADT